MAACSYKGVKSEVILRRATECVRRAHAMLGPHATEKLVEDVAVELMDEVEDERCGAPAAWVVELRYAGKTDAALRCAHHVNDFHEDFRVIRRIRVQ